MLGVLAATLLCCSGAAPQPSNGRATPSSTASVPAQADATLPADWLQPFPSLRALLPQRDVVMTTQALIDLRQKGENTATHELGAISTHGSDTCIATLKEKVRALGGKPHPDSRPGWFVAEGPGFEVGATARGGTCQVLVTIPLLQPQREIADFAHDLPGYEEVVELRKQIKRPTSLMHARRTIVIGGATYTVVEVYGVSTEKEVVHRSFERAGYKQCEAAGRVDDWFKDGPGPRHAHYNERGGVVKIESSRLTRGAFIGMEWPAVPDPSLEGECS